jgi:type IV pilus assembly protein PilC
MGIFSYEAVDRSGQMVRGRVEADQEGLAIERLHKTGLALTEISEVQKSFFTLEMHQKVKVGDLAIFMRQLSAMLSAGIPLTRALYGLTREVSNPTLKNAVGQVVRSVEAGISFSESLRNYPDVFPRLIVNMIYSGEISGSLDTVLKHISDQLERDKSLQDNIRSATMYPLVLLCFAFIVLTAMLLFVVPMFMKFFPVGIKMPIPTLVVIGMSNSMRHYWYIWIVAIAAIVYAFRGYIASDKGVRVWDKVKLEIPVFGQLNHKVVMARFARTMSSLLASGITIVQAMEASGEATGNSLVIDAVQEAGEKIREGKSIAGPLEESKIFTPMMVQMVAVGEESGSLPALLSTLADFYESEVAAMTKALTSLIEPLMIILVGGIIGFVVISLYMPMFLVVTSIK